MTKRLIDNQLETYEQRERTRRMEFIERMEQKWRTKAATRIIESGLDVYF